MELKNALAVCLISLFSATLVLLVARALDNQAASRLEPQLVRIAEELEAIRKQGGVLSGGPPTSTTDGVVMYYFHGNVRCPTCEAIESQSHAVLEKEFAGPLEQGEIVWKVVNFEADANADLRNRFEIQVAVVVLAKIKHGEIVDWKRLDQVWALWDDEPAFTAFMAREIEAMLDEGEAAKPVDSNVMKENTTEANTDLDSLPLPESSDDH